MIFGPQIPFNLVSTSHCLKCLFFLLIDSRYHWTRLYLLGYMNMHLHCPCGYLWVAPGQHVKLVQMYIYNIYQREIRYICVYTSFGISDFFFFLCLCIFFYLTFDKWCPSVFELYLSMSCIWTNWIAFIDEQLRGAEWQPELIYFYFIFDCICYWPVEYIWYELALGVHVVH